MDPQQPATVANDGRSIFIEIDGMNTLLTAQQAYDIREALGSVLSELAQPFLPWPRE